MQTIHRVLFDSSTINFMQPNSQAKYRLESRPHISEMVIFRKYITLSDQKLYSYFFLL